MPGLVKSGPGVESGLPGYRVPLIRRWHCSSGHDDESAVRTLRRSVVWPTLQLPRLATNVPVSGNP